MIILGIDPGLVQTGYGIISISDSDPKIIDYGIVKPDKYDSLSKRLNTIFTDIQGIIEEYHPTIMTIEEVFYGKNVKSTILLGHARGAAMVAAADKDIEIYEYSARKIKQSVTGNGNAHKEQVQFMVKAILKMNSIPEPTDASDALAVALCHTKQFRIADL